MKKTICILGALLLSLCIFSGCNGEKSIQDKLCHCWVFEGDDELVLGYFPFGFRFDADGKVYTLLKNDDGWWYEALEEELILNYTIDASNIKLTDSDGQVYETSFSLSGDKLIMTTVLDDGTVETDTLKKKNISPIRKNFSELQN